VQDGIHRMYEKGENIFYYITLYNENYPMPAMPAGEGVREGIIKGAYCWQPRQGAGENIDILASGSMMQQAVAAAAQLQGMGYAPAIWSVTSYVELAREAEACERESRLHPLQPRRKPYVESLFDTLQGPVIAVTDYIKGLPGSIARWMPASFTVLGTDGFGLSESREDLRNHFEVSSAHIVQAALVDLYRKGRISEQEMKDHLGDLGIDSNKVDPAGR
jgi:pyruvate dehydrogenase E1 component